MLDTSPLTRYIANKKSAHSLACCFVRMMVFFTLQKVFIFLWSYLLIADFRACVTGVQFRKSCSVPTSSRLVLTFSFISVCFMLRALIHLELGFVQGGKCEFIWIFYIKLTQFDQHQLLKMLSFIPVSVPVFTKTQCVDLGLGLQLNSAGQLVSFVTTHLFSIITAL